MSIHEQARAEAESLWPHEQYRTERPTVGERPRRVVGERISDWTKPDRWVWHLYDKADPEAWFTPVRCGGGINLPTAYETRPESDVCPDCLAGRKTL